LIGAFRISVLDEFKGIYEKSGIPLAYEDYRRIMLLLILMAFVLTVVLSTAVSGGPDMQGLKLVMAGLSISMVTSGLAALLCMCYPAYRKNEVAKKIDDGLPFTVGYMSILSSGGASLERIIERVSEVESNEPIKRLARKFMANVKLLGSDASSALEDVSGRCASESLSRLLAGLKIANLTSGDLRGLLDFELRKLLQEMREEMKKTVDMLTYVGELYVTFIVVAPIVFILLLTILSVIGGGSGSSAIVQMNLLVFLGIPIMAAGFAIALDTMIRGEE
jgi:archaellum biogenesis protein FlaJ (TadC family)